MSLIRIEKMNRAYPSALIETVERVRLTTGTRDTDWFDVLKVGWNEYRQFRSGMRPLSDSTLTRIAEHFGLNFDSLLSDDLDFQELAIRYSDPKNTGCDLPERYLVAAHGRRRASIASMEFLERSYGWRIRLDVLRKLQVPEAALQDAFAPISMQFMTDACEYLHQRHFGQDAFFRMGLYTYIGNRDSIVGKFLSELPTVKAVVEFFFTEAVKLFERNCRYNILSLGNGKGIVECRTSPQVSDEIRAARIGNEYVCQMKAGMLACLPNYIGLPSAEVVETTCEHRGDKSCCYEFDFGSALFEAAKRNDPN